MPPLAERMRSRTFEEFIGQEEIIAPDKPLRKAISNIKNGSGQMPSIILWGPPGSGKTTLAFLIAREIIFEFINFSAVTSGIKEIKAVMERAGYNLKHNQKHTVLFVDEIHRFNKAQQDAFLPYVEKGIISLIGATTENPSFEINSPLLSRCRVFVLRQLKNDEITAIIRNALSDNERGLGKLNIKLDKEAEDYIITIANGDARVVLNLLELSADSFPPHSKERIITRTIVEQSAQRKVLLYDRAGEEHFNLISAFHKSLRGSDPDASLYWLGRMLEAGEDPLYIARRMVRFASEDVGNADPQALVIAIAAKEAVDFVGMPEADNALAQAAIYLATAPKSNSIYTAYNKVKEDVQKTFSAPVPLHLRNPETALMAKLGYGKDYKYPHNFPQHFIKQNYLPENLKNAKYYQPSDSGFEKEIKKRIEYWNNPAEAGQK
ncbi:MAG: replication-associated recombination protein A [Planctomycetota bacterium]|nr:replication-associated recombination protein A [Planctomycetota bacterium]MDI6787243.1 replication-associated recombination protein A [Planctomycetota bacterium]